MLLDLKFSVWCFVDHCLSFCLAIVLSIPLCYLHTFRELSMLCVFLPPVVCRRADVLFILFVCVCAHSCVQHVLTVWVALRVYNKRQDLFILRGHLRSILFFGGVRVTNHFSVVGFLVLSAFVLCILYPMLPVSLDCPFSIARSVFSNVYSIYHHEQCPSISVVWLG